MLIVKPPLLTKQAQVGKATNEKPNLCDVDARDQLIFGGNAQKALCGLTLFDIRSNIVCSFSWGLMIHKRW